ncbi:MAG: hypothetical protein M1433_03065 [Candidatus Parvarchaeota archaeon]|nr:hypothetical protein [Candidatus Parvarchaeota archaeon]
MLTQVPTKASKGAVLHSSEHIFARSLQNLGLDIHVRKADTFRSDGKGFLFIKEKIPLQKLFSAEAMVNELIPKDLKVEMEKFDDISAASMKYNNIRFNEDRLKDTQGIRVVKIGDFDVSACKNEHVSSTAEIIAFAIVNVSYLGGETTVEFKAGMDAVNYLVASNDSILDICKKYNVQPSGISQFVKNAADTINNYSSILEDIFIKLIEQSDRDVIFVGNVDMPRFYKGVHKFMQANTTRCIILLSNNQLFALRGKDNSFILRDIGSQLLDKKMFVGEVTEDYLNGKVIDYDRIKDVLLGLPQKLV